MTSCTVARKEALWKVEQTDEVMISLNISHKHYEPQMLTQVGGNKKKTQAPRLHLRGLVCDGLGFRMYDGHFFCGYLGFLGCKRV